MTKINLTKSEIETLKHRVKREGDAEITWKDIRDKLNMMTDVDLDKPVQVIKSKAHPGKNACLPLVSFDKIDNLFSIDGKVVEFCRSVYDNEHHGEDFVFYVDSNHFSEDGDTMYLFTDEGLVGNNTGKLKPFLGERFDKYSIQERLQDEDLGVVEFDLTLSEVYKYVERRRKEPLGSCSMFIVWNYRNQEIGTL